MASGAQDRTMARWVSSQIEQPIEDLPSALADGTTIIDLINSIARDCASHTLTPVHKKPKLRLQKMENVDDALKFCRLVLQVNTCNVSAEDIVNRNVKLVLGFTWTLFLFSTSRSISVSNQTKSFTEIKSILLGWLNKTIKHNALDPLSNFNADWSFQQQRRPDLIFASIVDAYLPGLVKYSDYLKGKRLANLSSIIAFASKELQIQELVIPDDFNVLMPDEKCVVLYVLQWYMLFGSFDTNPATTKSLESEDTKLDSFVDTLLNAVKLKNRYSTKSLRLSNRMGSDRDNLVRLQKELSDLDMAGSVLPLINEYCSCMDESIITEDQLRLSNNLTIIQKGLERFEEVLTRLQRFKTTCKSSYLCNEFPELRVLIKSINAELTAAGVPCSHTPLKMLSLPSLVHKLEDLLSAEKDLSQHAEEVSNLLEHSMLPKIDANLQSFKEELSADALASSPVKAYTCGLESLHEFEEKLLTYAKDLKEENFATDLVTLTKAMSESPRIPQTSNNSPYTVFKDLIEELSNKSHLSFVDLKKFIKQVLSENYIMKPEAQEFIRLIPTRKLLVRSTSDEGSISSMSEDSDDSDSVFEKASKSLESKLMGAYNKIYDLDMFILRIEKGFDI